MLKHLVRLIDNISDHDKAITGLHLCPGFCDGFNLVFGQITGHMVG